MGITLYFAAIWSWIPSTLWIWLTIGFFLVLSFPILLSLILWISLKKYRLHIWPVSFFCYSHIKMVFPINECITIVLTLRHLSISFHKSRPFITFRLRGLKLHVIQYNFFKDPSMAQYVNDLKTRFLMGIQQKTGVVLPAPPPAVNRGNNASHGLSQSLFEKVEGILEEADLQFIDVKSESEKVAAISRYYSSVNRDPSKLYGDFNAFIPVANIAVVYNNEGALGIACEIKDTRFYYRTSAKISRINGVSLLVNVKKTVDVSLEVESADLNLYSTELNKLIFVVMDYLNEDSIYLAYHRYTRMAQYKAAGIQFTQRTSGSLEKLTVKAGPILGTIYGSTYHSKDDPIHEHKFPETDLKVSLPNFSLLYDCANPSTTDITIKGGNFKVEASGNDSLLLPQLNQKIIIKEERNEYGILEAYSLVYDFSTNQIEGHFSTKLYQWIVSFIEMSNIITIKSKTRRIITSMLADEYNSLHTAEEDRIKESQEDMQVTVTAGDINVVIYTVKGAMGVSLKGQNGKFVMHDDASIYAYTGEMQSLVVLAEQHRQLPIIKLKQAVVFSSVNKFLKKQTMGIQGEDASFKLYVPMYFEVFEEMCEYVIWSKLHNESFDKSLKPFERFYQGNAGKYIPPDFALLELGIANITLSILFSQSLVYTFRFESITNVPNSPLNTPYNILARKLTVDWAVFEKKCESKLFRGLVGSPEELRTLAKTQHTICELEDLTFYQLEEKEPNGERGNKTKLQAAALKLYFPDQRFHIGSSIYKFNYYTKFILKYSKKYYSKVLKDRCGITSPPRRYGHTALLEAVGFEMEAEIKEFVFVSNEDIVAKALANKYEISKRFGKYMTRGRSASELGKVILERLKDKSKEAGYCTTHMTGMHFVLKRPAKYCHYKNMYEVIKQLDESEDVPPVEACKFMSYMDLILHAKTTEISVRNYDLPLLSISDMRARYLMILTFFFSPEELNFMRPKKEHLYKTYLIEKQFIDIPRKLYYKMEFGASKIDINVQGIETLSEILPIYKKYARFEYIDMDCEKNEDYRYHWFKSLTGLSLYRYMMHGKSDVQIKNFVLHLFPDMYYPSTKPHLIVGMSNLNIKQNFYEVNIILKNLLIEKDQLQPNETALLCVPQIEVSALIVFNNDPKANHYLHYNTKTKEEFETKMSQFTGKVLNVTMKLNLASFYTPDNIPHTLSDTVEDIISKALSTHIHYQFSYLPLIIQTVDAFTQYSVPFKTLDKASRIAPKEPETFAENVPYRYHFQFYAFFNDL